MARVKQIMLTEVPTLKRDATAEEAAKLLVKSQSGCIIIVEGKKPIGIVTELDFVRRFASMGMILNEPVSRMMSSPVTAMEPDLKLDEALKIIDTKRYRKYPVLKDGRLVGLITKKDIINAMSENIRLHRNIQNTVLVLFVMFEFFVFVFSRYLARLVSFGA